MYLNQTARFEPQADSANPELASASALPTTQFDTSLLAQAMTGMGTERTTTTAEMADGVSPFAAALGSASGQNENATETWSTDTPEWQTTQSGPEMGWDDSTQPELAAYEPIAAPTENLTSHPVFSQQEQKDEADLAATRQSLSEMLTGTTTPTENTTLSFATQAAEADRASLQTTAEKLAEYSHATATPYEQAAFTPLSIRDAGPGAMAFFAKVLADAQESLQRAMSLASIAQQDAGSGQTWRSVSDRRQLTASIHSQRGRSAEDQRRQTAG